MSVDAHKRHFVAISPHRKHRARERHFVDIFRDVGLQRSLAESRSRRARMHARRSFSIVQNPACYVTSSLRKLVTLNLRYRSIGRPAGQPTDRTRRKAEERYSGTHRDIARASGWTECAFVPAVYGNADDFGTPLDFDSANLAVALCKACSITKSGIPGRWNLPFCFGELAEISVCWRT